MDSSLSPSTRAKRSATICFVPILSSTNKSISSLLIVVARFSSVVITRAKRLVCLNPLTEYSLAPILNLLQALQTALLVIR